MARIISWVIDGKYVYIKDEAPYIYDSSWSNEQVKAHGRNVLDWSEERYRTNFGNMYNAVTERWGTAIDLRADYSYYFNATGNEGVYMLTGIDGANTADYGKPFYNLVIENNNTSLGLGGDYILDVDTTVKTRIYLERNGSIYQPDTVTVKLGTSTVNSRTYSEGEKTRVEIDIPKDTSFANERVKEYVITATKGSGYTGSVSFTVVGVRDGAEGVSYDLVLTARQIKVSAEGNVSTYTVGCQVLKNGDVVSNLSEENLSVKYDFGLPTTDFDDVLSYSAYTAPISYERISASGDQVNFYLLFGGRTVIDTDSCTVSRDGAMAKAVVLELDNEVDGVGVGDDTILQLDNPVRLWTGMQMYSAGTPVTIERLSVEDNGTVITISQNDRAYPNGNRNNEFSVTGLTGNDVGFYTVLKNGFDFGEDFRDSIEITAYGTNELGESCSASATYVIIGIEGGEDGAVYKLSPDTDYILYDPNSNMVHWGNTTKDVSAINSNDAINLSITVSGKEYALTENDYIKWTTGVTYSTGQAAYGAQNATDKKFPISGLSIDEMTSENAVSKFVTFYWVRRIGSAYLLLDRETVPVLMQGINGNSVWVELGNEIDAVSVGDDTDLDITEDVEIGTTVRIMSGGTPIEIAELNGKPNIQILKPAGTESNWDGYAETGCTWASEDNGEHKVAYASVTLKNGFEFGDDYREVPTIKAWSVDGWSGSTNYVIKGIAGGIDGYVYRLVPNTDYVSYDPNMGTNGSLDVSAVTCDAYYGEYKLGEQGFTNGRIYYSINRIYDRVPENIPDTSSHDSYTTNFTPYDTSGINLASKINKQTYKHYRYVAFYLVVDGDIVDRETVKIVSSGVDGTNGTNAVRFDSTNLFEVINTGTDTILNVSSPKTYKTVVRGYEGVSVVPITLKSKPTDSSTRTITTASTSNNGIEVTVTLYDGFDFGADQKEKIDLVFRFTNNSSIEGTVSFTLACLLNGEGVEGSSYKLRSNITRIIADGSTFSPQNVTSGVYVGNTLAPCTLYYAYKSEGQAMSLADMMDSTKYSYSVSYTNNPNQQTVSAIAGTTHYGENGTLYIGAFSGGTFIDAEDIPIQLDVEGGSSSALIGDLTNDNGVVATGDNERLDNNTAVMLTTVATVRNGFDKLTLTNWTLPSTYTDPLGHGTIAFTGNYSSANKELTIGIALTATGNNYIDFSHTNPMEFQFIVSAQTGTSSSQVVQVTLGYSILALKYGKDGDRLDLLLNTDQIFYDTNKPVGERFSPSRIYPEMYVNGEKINDNIRYEGGQIVGDIMYQIKNSDMEDPDASELWLDSLDIDASGRPYFEVTELQTSEYEPLTIRAMSGNTLLDWETVQIYRNGQDGEGGLEVKISPERLGITVENSHPKVDYTGRTLVHLQSGSTIDPISSITAESDYADFGTASTKNVRYSVSNVSLPGLTNYKWVNITATTSATITTPIEIRLAVTSDTDGQTRYAVLILEPTTGGQGAQGDRGPKTRIREWSSGYTAGSGENYVYFAGDNGEPYWDIVYYEDPESNFVGYFGCKTSHTPSQGNLNEPSVVSGEGQTTQYWEYYPDYDFLATKVISIGGLDGWVIDNGKIQHTSSSVTLNADGEIVVQQGAERLYKFKTGSTEVVYVKTNNFDYSNADDVLTAYSAYTENGQTVYKPITDNIYFKSDQANKIYRITDVNLIYLAINGRNRQLSSENVNSLTLTEPISQDLNVFITFRRYDEWWEGDSIPGYETFTIEGTIKAGETSGVFEDPQVAASFVRMRGGGQEQNEEPGGGGVTPVDPGQQQEQVVPDIQVDDIPYSEFIDPEPGSPYENMTVQEYITGGSLNNIDPLVDFADYEPSYDEIINLYITTANTAGSGNQLVYSSATNGYIVALSVEMSSNVDFIVTPAASAITSPDLSQIAINKVLLSKDGSAISTANLSNSVQVKIKSVSNDDVTTPVISVGENLKITSDGKIVASNGYFSGTIEAVNGKFSGTADIKTGNIEKANIVDSDFTGNIRIMGENYLKMFNGNGDLIVELNDQTLTPSTIAKNTRSEDFPFYKAISVSDTSWWTSVASKENSHGNFTLFEKFCVDGDVLTIPSLRMDADLENISNVQNAYMTGELRITTSDGQNFTFSSSNEGHQGGSLNYKWMATGTESKAYIRVSTFSYTINVSSGVSVSTINMPSNSSHGTITTPSGRLKVTMSYSIYFQKKFGGKDATANIRLGSESNSIHLLHDTNMATSNEQYYNRFTVASNGFAFSSKNGGKMMMVADGSNDVLHMQAGANGMGVYIDNDEFWIRVADTKGYLKTYNVRRVLDILANVAKTSLDG